MISKHDNCLFVHIPKVAGQSIELAFLQRANLTWEQRESFLLKHNTSPLLGPPRLSHLTAEEYCALGYLSEKEFDDLYKFSFVRNPWDRLWSEYRYRQYPFTFKEFIFQYFPVPENDNYIKGLDAFRHVKPQYDFLYNKEGELLVDFVGKFENIAADFSTVSTNIIGKPIPLPYKNKSKQPLQASIFNTVKRLLSANDTQSHYSDSYDSEMRQWVDDHYAKDIELFDYTF